MTPDSSEPGAPRTPGAFADLGIAVTVVLSAFALLFGGIALAVASDDDSPAGAVASTTAAAPVPVELSEFAISPSPVVVGPGGVLDVVNTGSALHNLAVRDHDLVTADLGTDERDSLDVSSLPAGSYELYCTIPGHAEAGMVGTLTVGDAPAAPAAPASGDHDGHDSEDVDWAALDQAMIDSIMAFPAETDGRGNQRLEPEVLADGTLRFELTAEITEWEVEPGKVVEAWTYNGMVPGPWIKVEVGDQVEVVVRNRLPMGTDVHWHGVRTPNDQDGVAPITQPLIEAGTDYTYRFTAERPAVGMYHAHHHAHVQVVNGMLGVFQIGDVALPHGRAVSGVQLPETIEVSQEIPMVLNDAGVISYSLNGKSFPATDPVVVEQGEWVLVHYLNEGLQSHPMHQHQFPQLVVAKDGIPLDSPYFADTVNVAPGERYSVLMNPDTVGTWVWHCHILNHVERDDGMFGMVTAMVVN